MPVPRGEEWLLAPDTLIHGISKQENTSHSKPVSVMLSMTSVCSWDAVMLPVANTLDQDVLGSCAFIPHGFTNIDWGWAAR